MNTPKFYKCMYCLDNGCESCKTPSELEAMRTRNISQPTPPSGAVARYRIVAGDFGGEDYYDNESPDGPYVTYADHARIVTELMAQYERNLTVLTDTLTRVTEERSALTAKLDALTKPVALTRFDPSPSIANRMLSYDNGGYVEHDQAAALVNARDAEIARLRAELSAAETRDFNAGVDAAAERIESLGLTANLIRALRKPATDGEGAA